MSNGQRSPDLFSDSLLEWCEKLTGLKPERVRAATEKLASWDLPPVDTEILRRPDVDSVVAATLLAEGIDLLAEHGAERTQLLAKLRTDPYPWPAWAEIRAASIMVAVSPAEVEVSLEPGRSKGKQPDFRLSMPEGFDGLNVEFKALGLSDSEAAFCRRMSERLGRQLPAAGVATGHASVTAPTLRMPAHQRRAMHAESARLVSQIPMYPRGLTGSVAVAQGTEDHYVARLGDRLRRAIKQLPLDQPGWVAFHWTNGAPLSSIVEAIDWDAQPANLAGLIVLGDAVVFPHRNIDVFVVPLPRGISVPHGFAVDSAVNDNFAELVLSRVDASAGVRATLLHGEVGPGRSMELLRRDGHRRILPFNLVLSVDPPEFAMRQAS